MVEEEQPILIRKCCVCEDPSEDYQLPLPGFDITHGFCHEDQYLITLRYSLGLFERLLEGQNTSIKEVLIDYLERAKECRLKRCNFVTSR